MQNQNIVVYLLAVLLFANAIVYFIVAFQEYNDLIEFQQIGIEDETQEKQLEISVFLGSALVYLGLVSWVLKSRLKNENPYLVSAMFSIIMIGIYIASRTVGVPVVGVEYYIGKYNIITKVLQGIIIATSEYPIYRKITLNKYRTQEKNLKSKFKQIIIFFK